MSGRQVLNPSLLVLDFSSFLLLLAASLLVLLASSSSLTQGFFLGFLAILALPSLVAVVGGNGLAAGRLDWMKTQSGRSSAFSPILLVGFGCKKYVSDYYKGGAS